LKNQLEVMNHDDEGEYETRYQVKSKPKVNLVHGKSVQYKFSGSHIPLSTLSLSIYKVNIANAENVLLQFKVSRDPLLLGHLDTLSGKEVDFVFKKYPTVLRVFKGNQNHFQTIELVIKQS